MVDQTAGCDTYSAGRACTNVLHILPGVLGVVMLRSCTNNGNNIIWGGVCGWMDGWCRACPKSGWISDAKALLAINGGGTLTEGLHVWWGWDESCGPPFN